ncbi:MAG: TlyA family RNA methyltransferase [Cyanobacteriota bacterium]|jgi:23S rRNA (cytidine1920-2'-O)/16S rRNA (cytidine1409-2'-O)-methyltransferase
MPKQRLDQLLVERQLCESRNLAQRLIRAGEVRVNQQVIDKPGAEVNTEAQLTLAQKPPFVSRGGEKLQRALDVFPITVAGRVCLDGGISTGGFTDCLLQAGAAQVYGVDVGYGQVAWSLRQDSRVVLKERVNFRHLTPESLYGAETPADLGVMDLSFISLTQVLVPLWHVLVSPREVVLLIKPQFEVGRAKVGKNGVVRNGEDQAQAIDGVCQGAQTLGWGYGGLTPSPLKGPAGNVEYLLWLREEIDSVYPDLAALAALTTQTLQVMA